MASPASSPNAPLARSRTWVLWGGVAIAVLAALALAVTVLLAQRALSAASDVLVRGEAEAMAAAVTQRLRSSEAPELELEAVLAEYRGEGLRYLAFGERGGRLVESGPPAIVGSTRPGEFQRNGGRARFVTAFPGTFSADGERPPPPPSHHRPPPEEPQGGRPPPPSEHAREAQPPGPPDGEKLRHIVIELEPSVGTNLESDLRRILLVGGVTALALMVFALGWVRSLRKVEQFQREADRKKRLVALGQMSSIMAHELRNPLASLKGHAQLLAEQLSEDPKGQAKAELVVHEAERLESLTRNLLEFVRDGAIDTRLVPMRQLAEEALEGLDSERVTVHCEGSPEQVRVDRARIVRALHNLLENALLADPVGRAELRLRSGPRGLVIEIRDHGPGLPKEPIFEPFVTTRVRGTGLGLPIARRVAEQHGGELVGENHPEGGSVFRLTLPNTTLAV